VGERKGQCEIANAGTATGPGHLRREGRNTSTSTQTIPPTFRKGERYPTEKNSAGGKGKGKGTATIRKEEDSSWSLSNFWRTVRCPPGKKGRERILKNRCWPEVNFLKKRKPQNLFGVPKRSGGTLFFEKEEKSCTRWEPPSMTFKRKTVLLNTGRKPNPIISPARRGGVRFSCLD